MLRLTSADRAVAEIATVAEHVASLTAAAAAFQLPPDGPAQSGHGVDAPLVPLVNVDSAGEATEILAEIREWAREALGVDRAPAIWRALAHHPRLLQATWRKDRLVMAAGTVDEFVKGCAALAVAQFRQSPYWIGYLTHFLRARFSVEDRVLVEIAGAVMHYVSFNTIAHGMRLEPPFSEMTAADVAPRGRFEHHVPGVRRPTVPST